MIWTVICLDDLSGRVFAVKQSASEPYAAMAFAARQIIDTGEEAEGLNLIDAEQVRIICAVRGNIGITQPCDGSDNAAFVADMAELLDTGTLYGSYQL